MADKTASGSGGSSAQDSSKKVGLIGLVGIVISAMIGGGIYNLPQNMAADASAGAIIIAWVVTGIGIWFIANTFRILSAARPELTNGLYTYAEKGFGKLIGFFVAYGYWICNCFALVAYSVLVMATLNYFVPDFTGGNNIPSIIGGSIITWIMYLLALRGAKSTSFLNIIGTIGKLLPVFIFILAVATVFKFSVFMEGFWGMKDGVALTLDFSNVMPQVSSTMLVTLWLFLGIEGAVVVSGKAKSQAAVRKATTIGFLVTLALYIVVSLLPLGVYSQAEVGSMADPSMAAIMLKSFGKWGEIMVNAGVIVSVLSSWLVWMLMLGEMPLAASKSGIFPKMFVKENKNGSPSTSLLWTTIVVQVVLIISFFIGNNAWTTMISITSVMALPCYFFCTLFLFKIAVKKEYPSGIFASRGMAVFTGAAGSLYGLWLIYAAGLNYLMVACIVYAIGLPLYIVWACASTTDRRSCSRSGRTRSSWPWCWRSASPALSTRSSRSGTSISRARTIAITAKPEAAYGPGLFLVVLHIRPDSSKTLRLYLPFTRALPNLKRSEYPPSIGVRLEDSPANTPCCSHWKPKGSHP